MMAESVQPTAGDVAVRRLEPLAIEIPSEPRGCSVEALCDKCCPENMETKTKIYICILLILPSLIYFLVSINYPGSRRKHIETPTILNISTFSEERFSTEEYAESFDLAVKNDQLVTPTGISSETIRRFVATASFRSDSDEESAAVRLLQQS